MKITDIRVRKVTKQGKMRAVVSVTFDNEFVVHDIKVIEGERGLFIAMPSKKSADGEYRDIAHPINSDMRGTCRGLTSHFAKLIMGINNRGLRLLLGPLIYAGGWDV